MIEFLTAVSSPSGWSPISYLLAGCCIGSMVCLGVCVIYALFEAKPEPGARRCARCRSLLPEDFSLVQVGFRERPGIVLHVEMCLPCVKRASAAKKASRH